MGAVAMLKGPKDYLAKMMQGAELPFTALYFTCLLGTLYGALTSSYIYSVLFSAGQLGALSWYLVTDDGSIFVFLSLCAAIYPTLGDDVVQADLPTQNETTLVRGLLTFCRHDRLA